MEKQLYIQSTNYWDVVTQSKEMMEDCSCGRGQKVMYYCNQKVTCPNYET
jgi:hypothetical protein